MELLDAKTLREALATLPGWRRRRRGLERTFECKDFMDALRLVNRLGRLAERQQHHPDICIQWNKVTVYLTTHDVGGLTAKDLDLARRIQRMTGAA